MFHVLDPSLVWLLPVFGWFVKSGPIKEGHEALTKAAARGMSSTDVAALLKGVRAPDVDGPLTNHIKLAEQRRHCLRRVMTQSTSAALKDATGHLKKLHTTLIAARGRPSQLHTAGEALHLIQDSFSPAHAERKGRKVKRLRNYGPANLALGPFQMREHIFPIDGRDSVKKKGKFTGEASQAVNASREYLDLFARHTGPGKPSRATAIKELDAFVRKWLST